LPILGKLYGLLCRTFPFFKKYMNFSQPFWFKFNLSNPGCETRYDFADRQRDNEVDFLLFCQCSSATFSLSFSAHDKHTLDYP